MEFNNEINIDAVSCSICGRKFKMLNSHIRNAHSIEIKEYLERFSDDTLICKSSREKFVKNHKSPNSTESYIELGLSKEEAKQKVEKFRETISKSNKENGNNKLTLSYWLKRGYDVESAKKEISDLQRRDEEFFVSKYGEEIGREKYKDFYKKFFEFTPTKEHYINILGYSEEEYRTRFDINSLEGFIRRYGEEEGKIKYLELSDRLKKCTPYTEEYWINNGQTATEAKNTISNLQSRGYNFFVGKYGEDDGLIRYNNWKKKCSRNLEFFKNKYGEEIGKKKYEVFYEQTIKSLMNINVFSKESYKFLSELETMFDLTFGVESFEFYFGRNEKRFLNYFLDGYLNVFGVEFTIEYNGDFWHCNPETKWGQEEFIIFPRRGKTAVKEIWEKDRIRKERLSEIGIHTINVWSKEVKENKNKTIRFIIEEIVSIIKLKKGI